MASTFLRKVLSTVGIFLVAGFAVRYLLPVCLPFLGGLLLALTAEPLAQLGVRRAKMPRALASALAVSLTLVALLGIVSVLGALLVRQLGALAGAVPDIEDMALAGVQQLENFLLGLTRQLPQGVQPMLTKSVTAFFHDGSALMQQMSQRAVTVVSNVVGWVPDGAFAIGTGIFSGFLISGRLPRLKKLLAERMPAVWYQRYLPALGHVRSTMGLWLRAQGKLALTTYGIVMAGLFILRIAYAPLWAGLIALVDAVPMLGSGAILLPWALISLLQHEHLRAIGLLCVYATAFLSRSLLEPRIVGRQLGIDPLVTLFAIYAGFRFFGIVGLLLAPIVTAAVKTMLLNK